MENCAKQYAKCAELTAMSSGFSGQIEMHDACAVFYLWRPDLFKGRKLRVDVDAASPFAHGTTVVDLYGRGIGQTGPKNVFVTEKIDVKQFWENVVYSLKLRSALPSFVALSGSSIATTRTRTTSFE